MILTLSIYSKPLFFVKALAPGFISLGLFFCVCSDCSAKTVNFRSLRYLIRGADYNSAPLVERRFYFPNSPNGDYSLWPELMAMNKHTESATQITWYFSLSKTWDNWLYAYSPTPAYTMTVPDVWTQQDLDAVQAAYNALTESEQAAITGFTGYSTKNDYPFLHDYSFNYRIPGSVYGGGVVVNDKDGIPYLAYPDADGYVRGYENSGLGQYQPVYYDITSGQSVKLDTLPVSQTSLQYDDSTGQYSYTTSDYLPILREISYQLDNISLSPVVNVNPQVTVNPNVTVSAPEVTVTSPAPEVTVSVTNINGSSNLLQDANYIDPGFDPQVPQWTQEESDLISVIDGWQTSIPGIGDQLDGVLNVVVGRIPTFGSSLNIGTIEAGPYTVALDWTRYATIIAWIRSACLFVIVILFGIAVWDTVTQSLQV